MAVLTTARLKLRRLTPEDSDFVRRLLNEPSFIRYIGDRHVRSDEDARRYIRDGPMQSYSRYGFGLYVVELKASGTPAGICGLLKRDELDDVDVGFAFVPEFWRRGYAFEAATAVLDEAERRGFMRVLAIASPENTASIRLLQKLGFTFERAMRLSGETANVSVFAREVRTEAAR